LLASRCAKNLPADADAVRDAVADAFRASEK
jgi:hypothetical protein